MNTTQTITKEETEQKQPVKPQRETRDRSNTEVVADIFQT